MKNNLQQLQELKQKLGEGDVEYLFRLDKLIQEAYNQGVKDSVEALPEEISLKDHTKYGFNLPFYVTSETRGKNQYREEAITNISKLIQ